MAIAQPILAPPPGGEFTTEQWERIDEIIARWSGRPGALIPVLEGIQSVTGYLPDTVQRRVSTGLGLPLAQVYGVVTFYSFFTMKPRGRHQVRVCLGTACHVAGAPLVLATLEEQLGCEPGEVSADGEFGLEIVRCLGACGLAPVVEIGGRTHSGVRPGQVEGLLCACRERPAVADLVQPAVEPVV
jgi:NADH:ubiquinone oxidoreductase subunit E